jgi:hypothetical protein
MKKQTTQITNFIQTNDITTSKIKFADSNKVKAISNDVMKKHYDVLKKLADYDKQK